MVPPPALKRQENLIDEMMNMGTRRSMIWTTGKTTSIVNIIYSSLLAAKHKLVSDRFLATS